MTDQIFPPQDDPEEKAAHFIANPVKVRLPVVDARYPGGRQWVQMDLVALANNIINREHQVNELSRQVSELRRQVRELSLTVAALQSVVKSLNSSVPHGSKVERILKAIEKIASEPDDDDDEEEFY